MASNNSLCSIAKRKIALHGSQPRGLTHEQVLLLQADPDGLAGTVAHLLQREGVTVADARAEEILRSTDNSYLVATLHEMQRGDDAVIGDASYEVAEAGISDSAEGGGGEGSHLLRLLPGDTGPLSFELTEPMMVNLWAEAIADHDLTFRITGGPLPTMGYASSHAGESGESVSLKLTPGTYTLFVADKTDYGKPRSDGTRIPAQEFTVPLRFEMRPYRTQEIRGRVSIEGNEKVMPVSLRVAEFVETQPGVFERKEQKDTQPLDPSKPVWVVVHGRKDSERGNNIEYLAQSLAAGGQQVVTVDWHEAARDNGLLLGTLDGADWIPAVGKWATNQLKAAGFRGEQVLVPGPSWGSFVAYEIGKNFKEGPDGNGFGIQAIVALDTPLDPLPNSYPATTVVFNDVARASWAIQSSAFGSDGRANTAHVNFDLLTSSEILERQLLDQDVLSLGDKVALDIAEAYLREHGYAVSYFANLARGEGDASLHALAIDDLLAGRTPHVTVDPYGPEGILPITLREATGPEGTYWQAVPTTIISPQE